MLPLFLGIFGTIYAIDATGKLIRNYLIDEAKLRSFEAKLRENEAELTRLGADIGVRNERIRFLMQENESLRAQLEASYRKSA